MRPVATLRTAALTVLLLLLTVLPLTGLYAQDGAAEGGTCRAPDAGATCDGSGPASQSSSGGLDLGAGNPINVITGNKYQVEVDLPALPGELGLEIVRHYNSAARHVVGQLGTGWRLSYETDLYRVGQSVQILQADGRRLTFAIDPANPNQCAGTDPSQGWVEILKRGGYIWHWTHGAQAGRQLHFDGQGKLVQIRAASGALLTLRRGTRGELLQVTDPQGRSLMVNHGGPQSAQRARSAGQVAVFTGITSIDSPLGRFEYRHGSEDETQDAATLRAQAANLTAVLLPGVDGQPIIRHYHYEDARHRQALTGISVRGAGSDGEPLAERIATYAYDEQGKAVLSERGAQQVTLQYLAPALPTKEGTTLLTNSLGEQTLYRHRIIDGEYRLTEAVGAGCTQCGPVNRRWQYDEQGQLMGWQQLAATKVVDGQPAGEPPVLARHDIQRNAQGAIVRSDSGAARYDDPRWPDKPTRISRPSVVPSQQHSIELAYNEAGQITELTERGYSPINAEGDEEPTTIERTVRYGYSRINGRSVLAEVDGPLANGPQSSPSDSDITRYAWDENGSFVTEVTHPAGLTSHLQYGPASGRVTQFTGVDGVTTAIAYTPLGQISQMDRAGAITRYRQDALGRGREVLDPTGQRLHMRHDAAGQLLALFDQQDNRIELQRGSEGQLLGMRLLNPDGTVAQATGEYISAAGAEEPSREQALAGVRQLLASAEQQDNVARPELMVNPLAAVQEAIQAFFDPEAPRPEASHSATDSQGRVTTYQRDDFGRLVRVASPVTGVTAYRYDAAGHLTERIQADGSRASYQRDAAGRVIAVKSEDGAGHVDEDATIEWGAANKPVRIRYLAGEERFAYDEGARLTEHEQLVDGHRFTLHYEYDAAGRLIVKTLPDGQRLKYRYRSHLEPRAGLLESVWLQGLDNGTANRLTAGLLDRPIMQDLNGAQDSYQWRHFAFGNGLANETVLDAEGRIARSGNAQVGQTQLGYSDPPPNAGFVRTAFDREDAGGVTAYATHRVPLSRRAQEEAARAFISRTRGHLARWHRWPTQDGAGDGVQRLLTGIQGPARLDAMGRQDAQGDLRYHYDSLGRLTEVERATGSKEQPVARYRYNLFGQRIAKTVTSTQGDTSKTTYYFHDGAQLVAEADASGSITSQYVAINDKPVALLRGGQLLSIHTDHRNAPLALTDEARTVLWQASVADDLGSTPAHGDALGAIEFNLRGSNQYFDAETGLHYNTHRYYDPTTGRYLSPDPMGLAAGPNLHAYALGRPHEFTDPLGLQPILTDADVPQASFSEKLQYVFNASATEFPDTVGQALAELVSSENLATTAAVFALWAGSHAVGVGFIVDVVLTGLAWFTYGMAAVQMVKGLVGLIGGINEAKCLSDLDRGAASLSAVMMTAIGNVGGRPKAAGMLKNVRGKSATRAAKQGVTPPPSDSRALVISPLKIKEVAAKMTVDAMTSGRLKQIGRDDWVSAGGLHYKGYDPKGSNRIEHVTAHLTVNNVKSKQSIFAVPSDKLLDVLDEAWTQRGVHTVHRNGNWNYKIPMGRVIGANGETNVMIAVKPGTNEIVTSFPVM